MGLKFDLADSYARRINYYVPAMTMDASIQNGGIYVTSLGSPVVADTDGLVDGLNIGADGQYALVNGLAVGATVSGTAAGGVIGAIGVTADARFGRNVTLTGVTNPCDFKIEGYDYLGQPMYETIAAAATSAAGKKAFYRVTKITATDGGDADCDVGWGDVLGLPFATKAVLATTLGGTLESTAATLVGAVLTDPQTATTGDPRGTVDLNSACNGTEIVVVAVSFSYINASGNGGLHGIRHYYP